MRNIYANLLILLGFAGYLLLKRDLVAFGIFLLGFAVFIYLYKRYFAYLSRYLGYGRLEVD